MIDFDLLYKELSFQAARSGGKGGQNVNKVATKVILSWSLYDSTLFNEEEKKRLYLKLNSMLTKEGRLVIQCSETRSQLENRQIAAWKIYSILLKALEREKSRVATKIPKKAIEKRIENKKKQAEKKLNRRGLY